MESNIISKNLISANSKIEYKANETFEPSNKGYVLTKVEFSATINGKTYSAVIDIQTDYGMSFCTFHDAEDYTDNLTIFDPKAISQEDYAIDQLEKFLEHHNISYNHDDIVELIGFDTSSQGDFI